MLLYSCGPTVYSYAHIGNFRSFLLPDLLRRVLQRRGHQVRHVMNITDVGHMTQDHLADASGEDKLSKAARELGWDPYKVARHFEAAFVEDAGDTLHRQRNALDSAWLLDTNADYSKPTAPPLVRFIAQGRDPSATLDSALLGSASDSGFQNEGDNELTGLHVSNGSPGPNGILGAQIPRPFHGGRDQRSRWRAFYTQQHGDNPTYELIAAPGR